MKVEISVDGNDGEVLGILSVHTYMLNIYLLLFFVLTQAGLACHSTHHETFPSTLVSEVSLLLSMNSPPATHSKPIHNTCVTYNNVESKWKNYHIITFPGQSLSKNRETHH
jgi:hypothetical protein